MPSSAHCANTGHVKGKCGFSGRSCSRPAIHIWPRGQGNALREGHEWSKKLANIGHVKVKEQSFFSNNFILLNHIQVCFITIYDGCLT